MLLGSGTTCGHPSNVVRSIDLNATPPVPRWAVWLNALWFSGLILSLTSASLCIMVRQWLNEYSTGLPGSKASRQVSRIRQYRLDNLKKWRVEDIVGTIPVLLQVALGCFLTGVLVLLWSLHITVAAIASILVGILAVFTISTTVLPLFNRSCAYLSPQTRVLYSIWQPKRFFHRLFAPPSRWFHSLAPRIDRRAHENASDGLPVPSTPSLPRSYLPRIFQKVIASLLRSARNGCKVLGTCVPDSWAEPKQTWQGRERSTIYAMAQDLDTHILVEAYNSTLHPAAVDAAEICIVDLDSAHVVQYFKQLHDSLREHFGSQEGAPLRAGLLAQGGKRKCLWLQILFCTFLEHRVQLTHAEAAALRLLFIYPEELTPARSVSHGEAQWMLSAFSTMIPLLEDRGADEPFPVHVRDETLHAQRIALIGRYMQRGTNVEDGCFDSECVIYAYIVNLIEHLG